MISVSVNSEAPLLFSASQPIMSDDTNSARAPNSTMSRSATTAQLPKQYVVITPSSSINQ
jgi:hypothetical protein